MKRGSCFGFTLVELLVVIAIIGVLVAALMPAVQASRELARRATCTNNIAQLLLAVRSYEDSFESLPPGVTNPDGPIRSEPAGEHQGWLLRLLPYVDEVNAFRRIDFSKSVYDAANAPVRDLTIELFLCPSSPNMQHAVSDYAACHNDVEAPIAADNHGVFFLNSHVRREEITDGASHTLFIGEKWTPADDLGWMSGTRATLRNTGLPMNDPASRAAPANPLEVGGFASEHPTGMNLGFGDGTVKFVADSIDPGVWQQLGNRADGKLLDAHLAE